MTKRHNVQNSLAVSLLAATALVIVLLVQKHSDAQANTERLAEQCESALQKLAV